MGYNLSSCHGNFVILAEVVEQVSSVGAPKYRYVISGDGSLPRDIGPWTSAENATYAAERILNRWDMKAIKISKEDIGRRKTNE